MSKQRKFILFLPFFFHKQDFCGNSITQKSVVSALTLMRLSLASTGKKSESSIFIYKNRFGGIITLKKYIEKLG